MLFIRALISIMSQVQQSSNFWVEASAGPRRFSLHFKHVSERDIAGSRGEQLVMIDSFRSLIFTFCLLFCRLSLFSRVVITGARRGLGSSSLSSPIQHPITSPRPSTRHIIQSRNCQNLAARIVRPSTRDTRPIKRYIVDLRSNAKDRNVGQWIRVIIHSPC